MTALEQQISNQIEETVERMFRKAKQFEPTLTRKAKLGTVLAILEHNKIKPGQL